MREAPALPFRASLISNRSPAFLEVAEYSRAAGSREAEVRDLPLAWPPGVYSLGHVAIPFPPDDPVYGLSPAPLPGDGPRLPIGSFSARGESGALLVPLDLLARLRSNPFFDVVREKVVAACREDRPLDSPNVTRIPSASDRPSREGSPSGSPARSPSTPGTSRRRSPPTGSSGRPPGAASSTAGTRSR